MDEEKIKQVIREPLLYMAHRLGYISEFNEDALWQWWDSLPQSRKEAIAKGILAEEVRRIWNERKFKTPGWRAGLAGTMPVILSIRCILVAPGWQKLWAIAIFFGGMFLMRFLINSYDNWRGNPRKLPDD